jgi:hypothetical protein
VGYEQDKHEVAVKQLGSGQDSVFVVSEHDDRALSTGQSELGMLPFTCVPPICNAVNAVSEENVAGMLPLSVAMCMSVKLRKLGGQFCWAGGRASLTWAEKKILAG